MGRLLDEDDVIDAVSRGCQEFRGIFARCEKNLNELPPAQPEPSIPISWIDEQIEWLKELDNGFSTITAMQILTMVNKWNREGGQNE